MAELRLMIVNERTIKITSSVRLKGGVIPYATPMISEPKLGKRNSALETIANCLMDSNMMR
jgi:hypothetical protein